MTLTWAFMHLDAQGERDGHGQRQAIVMRTL